MKLKLLDYSDDIERGAIIRCKAKYPYEDVVDFLVCESYDANTGYTLLVATGYKAGLRFIILPKESVPAKNSGYAINTSWLKKNWNVWGYTDCPIQDVWVIENKTPQW